MRLIVSTPVKVILDAEVDKVAARAPNGRFCLLPRHVDFVSALAPGVLSCRYARREGGGTLESVTDDEDVSEEEILGDDSRRHAFIYVDSGILVKKADEVLVSARSATPVPGPANHKAGSDAFVIDEAEAEAGDLLAELERDFTGRYLTGR